MKKSRLFGAVCACVSSFITISPYAAPVTGQGTWETTLQGRDLDGNAATFEAYYDTDLDITWLADANLIASNAFGLPYSITLGRHPSDTSTLAYSHISRDGRATWGGAMFWIDAMNMANYGGTNQWRLPMMTDVGNDGMTYTNIYEGVDGGYNIDTANGEIAHMFYDTLGNDAPRDTSGTANYCLYLQTCLTNTGPFSNFQEYPTYWYSSEYAPDTEAAWLFQMFSGLQSYTYKDSGIGIATSKYAWAVHSGDVSAVPIPASLWLFGSGLLGLIGVARRKAA